MKINLTFTKLEATPAIHEYCQEKMDMLDKYFGDIEVINCDVEVEKIIGNRNKGRIFRAEVNIQVPKEILRVEKTEKNLYKAIDKVKDHLMIMITKYKNKRLAKERR